MHSKDTFWKFTSMLVILLLLFSTNSDFPQAQANRKLQNSSEPADYIEQELLLHFQSNVTYEQAKNCINMIAKDALILDHYDDFVLIKLSSNSSLSDSIEKFNQCEKIKTAEPNYILSKTALTNDKYILSQWPLQNTGRYESHQKGNYKLVTCTKDIDLNLKEAWENYKTKNEVIVAIIDTGIDVYHKDLKKNIWTNEKEIPWDGIDNDGNGYIDDYNGWDFYNEDATVCHYSYDNGNDVHVADKDDNDNHGTHIAGIIGAVANNKVGIAGVASNIKVKLMPLKVLGGESGTGSISDSIKAIKYAEKNGAKVCNFSWGTTSNSEALYNTLKESSMLFVTAAGNSGYNIDEAPFYPAAYDLDNVLSVTFITANGKLTTLSNYGPKSVDIVAPGNDIYSTIVGDRYASMSGSSMAAPHVSGIAAMIYSYAEHLYPKEVKSMIIKTLAKLPSLKNKVTYPGLPDAGAVVRSFPQLKSDTKKPTLNIETIYHTSDLTLSLSPKDEGGSQIRVIKYMYGKHSLSEFEHGTSGTSVTENVLALKKSGFYTFYISDYAGNEHKVVYKLVDDTVAPTIKLTYSDSNKKGKVTVQAKIKDATSGVKLVKYIEGTYKSKKFLTADFGTKLKSNHGVYEFECKPNKTYTVFAIDYRGNTKVKYITPEK